MTFWCLIDDNRARPSLADLAASQAAAWERAARLVFEHGARRITSGSRLFGCLGIASPIMPKISAGPHAKSPPKAPLMHPITGQITLPSFAG